MLVAALGIGLALGARVHATAAQRDKERELLAVGRQFRAAIASYHALQPGAGARHEYPATLEDLLLDNRLPGARRHLRRVFVDPMTGKAEWGLVRVGGRIVGVHSLSDAVPIKRDGFDPDEGALRGRQKYSEWVFAPAAAAQPAPESASGEQR